jgi:hypothetical protein
MAVDDRVTPRVLGVATEPQLADVGAHYERCCFVACTSSAPAPRSAVRSSRGPFRAVARHRILWGDRTLTAEAADTYRAQGLRACELRLPVQAMGAACHQRLDRAPHFHVLITSYGR